MTIRFFKADLRSLGVEDDDFAKAWERVDPQHPEAYNFEGRDLLLSCSHNESNGKTYENWGFYFKPEDPRSIDAEQYSVYSATFGALFDAEVTPEGPQSPQGDKGDPF